MICRAWGCRDLSMPNGPFCGFHDEANEERPVKLKPGARPGKIPPEQIAKRVESRKRNKAALLAKLRKEAA